MASVISHPQLIALSSSDKKKLLQLARESMERHFSGLPSTAAPIEDAALNQVCGAFVTLRKNGKLRGCIGNLPGNAPLYQAVQKLAVSSATEDSRFQPVEPSELPDLCVEITVLSPLKKVQSPDEIVPGVHGVMIEKGPRTGIFLPQVATEQNWSRMELLENLCVHKAGLTPEAWRESANLYIFTGESFKEENE